MTYPPRHPRAPKPQPADTSHFLSRIVMRVGQLVALLAFFAIMAVVADQLLHLFKKDYTFHQRTKHAFMCYNHSREVQVPENADALAVRRAQIEQNIYVLMDVVRQQNAPTEFLGKVRYFGLCSTFSKAGIGGFEVSGAKDSGQSAVRIDKDEAQQMLGNLDFLAKVYPDFPVLAVTKLRCELRRLQNFSEAPSAVCVGGEYRQAPIAEFLPGLSDRLHTCDTTDEGMCVPAPAGLSCACRSTIALASLVKDIGAAATGDAWLVVVGADQTDRAAADQVSSTRALIADQSAEWASNARVELRLLGSWRRTVIVFDTRENAEAALAALGGRLQYGGYVRLQSQWCPDLADADPIRDIPTMICETPVRSK